LGKARLVFATIALFGVYSAQSGYAADADIDLSGFTLTWHDEFNQELNVLEWGPIQAQAQNAQWIAHTPWSGDFGDSAFSRAAFSLLPGGGLKIKAWKTQDGKWHSGLLSSVDPKGNGFRQKYGYFEVKMQVPGGLGTWPAFWLSAYPANPSAEIDVVELYGGWPDKFHCNWHEWNNGAQTAGSGITITAPTDLTTDFHIYGVLVEPNFITWYLDGEQVWQQPTMDAAKQPLGILLDYALGSGWGESGVANPSYLNVQWVRVYQRL
jgi:hypothetical protein